MILRRRGLGYTPENCSPLDVECVGRNSTANAAAGEQVLIDSKLAEAQRCRDKAKLSPAEFQPGLLAVCDQITAQAAVLPTAQAVGQDYARYWDMTAYGQNPNLVSAENWNKFTGAPAPGPTVSVVPAVVKAPAPAPVASTRVINSSGAQNAPQRSVAVESPASALSEVPWYVWAGGAAVVVMIARSGGGR